MRLLRPDQAADRLNVNVRTIYRLIDDGELPALRVRKTWRIPEGGLDGYISKRLQINSYETGYSKIVD